MTYTKKKERIEHLYVVERKTAAQIMDEGFPFAMVYDVLERCVELKKERKAELEKKAKEDAQWALIA